MAYGRLSRRDRLALHLAAAQYFERTGSDELAGIVASHYLSALRGAPDDLDRADLVSRAINAALEAAASRSRAIGAHASAAAHLADAVSMAEDDPTRLRLLESRASALQASGRYADAESVARGVVESAQARGEPDRAARAGTILTSAVISAGRPTDAVAAATDVQTHIGSDAFRDPDGIRLSAELARAYLMSGDSAAARELVDRILPVADRLGLREVVAELLPSRGWAIAADGRAIEAVALLRGGLVFAEREGLFSAEMRSRMNLTAYNAEEEPTESVEVAWIGAKRAAERGYVGWAISAGGNACDAAFRLGAFDRVEAMAAELEPLDVLGSWANAWDFSVAATVCNVRSYRGQGSRRTRDARPVDARFPDVGDPQVLLTTNDCRAHLAFAEGDLTAAVAHGRQVDRLVRELGSSGITSSRRRSPSSCTMSTGQRRLVATWRRAAIGASLEGVPSRTWRRAPCG